MPARPSRSIPPLLALLAATGGLARHGTAQQQPADPAAQEVDTTAVVLPEHEERVLSNGLRVLLVPDFTAGATVYTLFVPGGSAGDPDGREGTSALLAMLMEDVAAHDPRMALGVAASTDALALTLVDSTHSVPASARRLGDAIAKVQLTDSAVAAVRDERMPGLTAALEQPDVVANRVLMRAVYGDHPYGRGETPASLGSVRAADLAAWRDAYLRPGGAVLAVTGPVEADEAVPLLEAGFRAWDPGAGATPEPASAPLAPGVGGRRVLVHVPGMTGAIVQSGIDLPEAGHPDWTRIALLDQVLTGGPQSPLVTLHPPGAEEGIIAGTVTAAQRRRGPGVFQARAAVNAGVAAEVVRGLLAGLADAGESFVSPDELRPVQRRMAGAFRAQLSVPAGAAALMAVNRVLGLEDSLMVSYPVRVARIGPQDLRDVAATHLDTARTSVVVIGDAGLIRADLAALGDFELVDAAAAPLAAEDVEVPEPLPALDASLLEPLTLEYGVMLQGERVGDITRSLEPGPDPVATPSMTFRSRAALGVQEVTQHVTFTVPGFRPLSAGAGIAAQGQSAGLEVTVAGGRVTGSMDVGPGRSQPIDEPLPDDALLGDMLEVALWMIPLDREGAVWRVAVLAPEAGEMSTVVVRVGAQEEVTVPAGTFRTRRVDVGGEQPETYWISVEEGGPRVPVRMAPVGRPVVIELLSVTRPGG